MGATNPNAGGAPGGGGKGGVNQHIKGPAGNAQNNPGMHQFAQLGQQFNGLGSAGPGAYGQPTGMMPGPSVGQSLPMSNWQSMLKGLGSVGGMPAFNLPMSYGGSKPAFGGGLDTSGMTPISANLMPPTPQPHPQPRTTAAGLPAGGILARLYGG